MTKIKLNWAYAKGELDTNTLKMLCIPARGKRIFGEDEMNAELCIKDKWNLSIAEIHLGDVESSNILCEEITRRWNEFQSNEWHECKDDTEDMPEIETNCILRVEYQSLDDGEWYTDYLTSTWGKFGWAEDYLERITDIANEYKITHWKPINKPKGVEE
ncbi:hypothetical protein KFX78_09685 [Bacteroides thetaiotaomicron]|uniref:DUF551 domain-containing protein n=1 Tax=Bacteroides thetaiotaomicron TaxID=818 RepID=UPI001CE295A2|nr:DUF551 domain-containing protein [Bacteroides thetaiotaomicron]MCA6054462.1 hypothetical protein [Bacteroides thetaiotaomicron]